MTTKGYGIDTKKHRKLRKNPNFFLKFNESGIKGMPLQNTSSI